MVDAVAVEARLHVHLRNVAMARCKQENLLLPRHIEGPADAPSFTM